MIVEDGGAAALHACLESISVARVGAVRFIHFPTLNAVQSELEVLRFHFSLDPDLESESPKG